MAPERRRDARGRSGVHVKPHEDDDVDSEGLDRLLGDVELLTRLQLSGYARDQWEPVATEFARYGMGVIQAWIRTGKIYREVREATRQPLVPPQGPLDEETIHDLVTETVTTALRAFLEKVLKQNKWDPNKGASLKTFFIGQCKFQFLPAYRKWVRSSRRRPELVLTTADELSTPVVDPADHVVIAHENYVSTLEMLSTQISREAAALKADGYTVSEIAELLNLPNARAVTNMLNHQQRVLDRKTQESR